jgi:hypothetical protein
MHTANSNFPSIQEARMLTLRKGLKSPLLTSVSRTTVIPIPHGKKITKARLLNPFSCSRFCPMVRSSLMTRRWISLPSITNDRWGLWRLSVNIDQARAFCSTNSCISRTMVSAWTNQHKRAHREFGCGRTQWRIASKITMCFLSVTFCLIVDT